MAFNRRLSSSYVNLIEGLDNSVLTFHNFCFKHARRWSCKHGRIKKGDKIDPQFKREVVQYWRQYTTDFTPIFHKYYSSRNGIYDVRYVPDDWYYTKIDQHFNNRKFFPAMDDKNYYSLLYPEARQPVTVIRKINGIFLSPEYSLIPTEEAIERCLAHESLIIKPAVGTGGSKGIRFWDKPDSPDDLKKILTGKDANPNLIIQELLTQHQQLSRIHPNSVNSVRTTTLLFQGKIHVLSSVLRMGVGDSRVDNAAAGGYFCGINADGRLKELAYSKSGMSYDKHPQGFVFSTGIVPSFDKVITLVRTLQAKMVHFRLISWDIAVGLDGEPVLIETNLSSGSPDLSQLCNGPLFGDLTDDIMKEVFG